MSKAHQVFLAGVAVFVPVLVAPVPCASASLAKTTRPTKAALLLTTTKSTATVIPLPKATAISLPTAPATASATSGEAGGEGGGEAALITHNNAKQSFSISRPAPWTQDTTKTNSVKFDGGDGSRTLSFLNAPAGKDAIAYARADAKSVASICKAFEQVSLAASTDVPNAIMLGFESLGRSTVTGKDVGMWPSGATATTLLRSRMAAWKC